MAFLSLEWSDDKVCCVVCCDFVSTEPGGRREGGQKTDQALNFITSKVE